MEFQKHLQLFVSVSQSAVQAEINKYLHTWSVTLTLLVGFKSEPSTMTHSSWLEASWSMTDARRYSSTASKSLSMALSMICCTSDRISFFKFKFFWLIFKHLFDLMDFFFQSWRAQQRLIGGRQGRLMPLCDCQFLTKFGHLLMFSIDFAYSFLYICKGRCIVTIFVEKIQHRGEWCWQTGAESPICWLDTILNSRDQSFGTSFPVNFFYCPDGNKYHPIICGVFLFLKDHTIIRHLRPRVTLYFAQICGGSHSRGPLFRANNSVIWGTLIFCKLSNVVSKEAFNVETVHVKILYDLQTTSSSKFSVTFHLPLRYAKNRNKSTVRL